MFVYFIQCSNSYLGRLEAPGSKNGVLLWDQVIIIIIIIIIRCRIAAFMGGYHNSNWFGLKNIGLTGQHENFQNHIVKVLI